MNPILQTILILIFLFLFLFPFYLRKVEVKNRIETSINKRLSNIPILRTMNFGKIISTMNAQMMLLGLLGLVLILL